jgi:hypothetical protein
MLKTILDLIGRKGQLNIICFNFVSSFLSKIKNNIYDDEKIDKKEIYKIVIDIINKSIDLNSESHSIEILNPLILIFQLFILNNDLDEQKVTYLINETLNQINYITSESDEKSLEQVILAIICLGFLYYPETTLRIFNEETTTYFSSSPKKIEKFLNLLNKNILTKAPYYNILLNKCIIIGISRFWLKYINYFEQNENIKLNLFIIISNLMIKQKIEKTNILKAITNKDIKCNFTNEDDDEDEEEEIDYAENNDFNETIEMALSSNEDIINCDEFQIFSEIVKYIRKYDSKIYELYINGFNGNFKLFEDLLLSRNLKVKYYEKDYIICRKILNLKGKNNK